MSTTQTRTRTRARADVTLNGSVGATQVEAAPATETTTFYQATMTPDKFASFNTHPRQRDTERHAAYAKDRHLKNASITQANVSAACLNGEFFKLDGHTRSHLWQGGSLQKPEKLTVTIYNVDSYAGLLDLYTHFDNKFAAETGIDVLSGVLREAGITMQSQMFRDYRFLTALKYAYGFAMTTQKTKHPVRHDTPEGLARMVDFFKDEIIMLDSVDPNARLFKAAVTAGAFLTLKRRGEAVLPFFEALTNNRGTKTETECDGVQALHSIILTGTQRARTEANLLTGRTISCVEAWRDGRTYSLSLLGAARVKQTDIVEYTKTMRRERPARDAGTDTGLASARARSAIETILPATL